MKHLNTLVAAAVLLLASCGTGKETANSGANTGAVSVADSAAVQPLTAKMEIKPLIEAGSPFELRFTVYNKSGQPQKFCKWHTPFEPPMSKYLDVRHELGAEAEYKGAMAKRIMPPPADSYIEVKAGDSLSVTVDLNKSYQLTTPGKYSVKYNSSPVSGIVVPDSLNFVYKK